MVERTVQWDTLLIAGVLTVTIVAGLFFMGKQLNNEKIASIEQDVKRFNIQQSSQELARKLAENLPNKNCEALNIAVEQTIEDVQELQDQVAQYEQVSKVRSPEFTTLKKDYTNMLLEYWITTQKVEETCGSPVLKILYLYSDDDTCPRCQDQGKVLTHYLQEYEDELLVFPLDTTLDMQTVNLIEDAYQITQHPSLIIDGEPYTGYKDKETLGQIIETHMNQTATEEPA